jgi:hypothetical protein
MTIKTASAKAKGRRLQQWLRDVTLQWLGTRCEAGDVRCAIMGETGGDLKFSPLAKTEFPLSEPECKNQKKLRLKQALEQAKSHGPIPWLCFTERGEVRDDEIWVCIKALDFFDLL